MTGGPDPLPPTREASGEPHTTAELLRRARTGEPAAREALAGRFLEPLRRWAHRRLPPSARGLLDTDDLVQIALLRTFQKWDEFEPEHPGALFTYLRRALIHRLRDELRRVKARPGEVTLPEAVRADEPSPLELAITREGIERYEAALARLPEMQQEAVLMRIELGASFPEIATALGSPSPNAARMMVVRALVRLAEAIDG